MTVVKDADLQARMERNTQWSDEFRRGYTNGYQAAKNYWKSKMQKALGEKESEHLDVNRTFPYNIVPYITGEYSNEYLNGESDTPSASAQCFFSPEQMLKAMAQILSEREMEIIRLRFDRRMTLEEVGMELGVTRERVRQLESKALRKLTNHIRELQCVPVSELDTMRKEIAALKRMVDAQQQLVDKHEQLMARPITELDLSVRAYNCLKRAGIDTFGDLCSLTDAKVQRLRNLGMKSYREICDAMKEAGLKFAEEKNDGEGAAKESAE